MSMCCKLTEWVLCVDGVGTVPGIHNALRTSCFVLRCMPHVLCTFVIIKLYDGTYSLATMLVIEHRWTAHAMDSSCLRS
jgi:hypothetical protein